MIVLFSDISLALYICECTRKQLSSQGPDPEGFCTNRLKKEDAWQSCHVKERKLVEQ
jgi:hypothetical protein